MAKIDNLTPEQEALLPEIRDKWIKLALTDGPDLDIEKARQGIEWMYDMTGLKKPIVLVVDSPLAAQYATNVLKIELSQKNSSSKVSGQVSDQVSSGQVSGQVSDQVSSGQVWDQVWDQVSGQVWDQVSSGQVWDQVWDQVSGQVWDQVSGQVWDQVSSDQVSGQVWDQVSDQVSGQVWDQVSGQVSDQVWDQVSRQVQNEKLETFTWAWESLAWRSDDFSFYDFFYQIGIVDHEGLKRYLDYLQSGVFFAMFLDGFAIVSRRPTSIRRDTSHLLDSDQLPAIEFKDGYKLWFLHGVSFKENVWERVVSQELTLPELAQLNLGADQRAVAIQMLRPDRLLEQMGAKKIATGVKYTKLQDMYGEDYCAANFPWSLNSPTELYEVKNFMDTERTEYCMKMEHPSIKGKFYIEWCNPQDIDKAKEQSNLNVADYAQSSAFGMSIEEYYCATEA